MAGRMGITLLGLMVAGGTLSGCAARTSSGGPEAAESGQKLGQIRVVTFNLHQPFDDVPSGLGELISEYRAALSRQRRIGPLLNDYDLVLLQESFVARVNGSRRSLLPSFVVDSLYQPLKRASELPFRSGYQDPLPPPQALPIKTELWFSDGLVRFSQLPFEAADLERVAWETCHGPDCYTNKGFSFVRTNLAAGALGSIDVYNLHMNAGGAPEDIAARRAQAEQLAQAILTFSGQRALIVAGDFNLSSSSDHPERAAADSDTLARLLETTGLVDTYRACVDQNGGCDSAEEDRILIRSAGGSQPQLTLRAASWLALGAGTPFAGLSDHQAVQAVVEWEQSP